MLYTITRAVHFVDDVDVGDVAGDGVEDAAAIGHQLKLSEHLSKEQLDEYWII